MPAQVTAAQRFFVAVHRWNSAKCKPTCPSLETHVSSTARPFPRSLPRFSTVRCNSTSTISTTHITGSLNDQENGTLDNGSTNSTATASLQVTEASLPHRMRAFMRHIPHPVALITTCASAEEKSENTQSNEETKENELRQSYRAMTVSSFNTLSLNPEPIVTFNCKVPSRTLDSIMERGYFRITMLSSTRSCAEIADAFTRGHAEDAFKSLGQQGVHFVYNDDVPYAPQLKGPEVLADLQCQLMDKTVKVNDHVIVIARVLNTDFEQSLGRLPNGLMYIDGAYKRIGSPLLEHKVVSENEDATEAARPRFFRKVTSRQADEQMEQVSAETAGVIATYLSHIGGNYKGVHLPTNQEHRDIISKERSRIRNQILARISLSPANAAHPLKALLNSMQISPLWRYDEFVRQTFCDSRDRRGYSSSTHLVNYPLRIKPWHDAIIPLENRFFSKWSGDYVHELRKSGGHALTYSKLRSLLWSYIASQHRKSRADLELSFHTLKLSYLLEDPLARPEAVAVWESLIHIFRVSSPKDRQQQHIDLDKFEEGSEKEMDSIYESDDNDNTKRIDSLLSKLMLLNDSKSPPTPEAVEKDIVKYLDTHPLAMNMDPLGLLHAMGLNNSVLGHTDVTGILKKYKERVTR